MYSFWETERVIKWVLIGLVILFFGIPIVLTVIGMLTGVHFISSSNTKSCATVTEPYSNVEHDMYCDGDYDWIDAKIQESMDNDQAEDDYRAERAQEEYERREAEYWEEYCNANPYECY